MPPSRLPPARVELRISSARSLLAMVWRRPRAMAATKATARLGRANIGAKADARESHASLRSARRSDVTARYVPHVNVTHTADSNDQKHPMSHATDPMRR
jgi:hypothetical protein